MKAEVFKALTSFCSPHVVEDVILFCGVGNGTWGCARQKVLSVTMPPALEFILYSASPLPFWWEFFIACSFRVM
jgi:hypothetical protein